MASKLNQITKTRKFESIKKRDQIVIAKRGTTISRKAWTLSVIPVNTISAAFRDDIWHGLRQLSFRVFVIIFLSFIAAMGAVSEFRIDFAAALTAGVPGLRCRTARIGLDAFDAPPAPIAHQEGGALFHPPYRNEKQAQVMVHAPEIGLVQAAQRTAPGGVIDFSGFGLHAGNKYKRKHDAYTMMAGWMISLCSIDIEADRSRVKFQLPDDRQTVTGLVNKEYNFSTLKLFI
jgi:hypothetical protein